MHAQSIQKPQHPALVGIASGKIGQFPEAETPRPVVVVGKYSRAVTLPKPQFSVGDQVATYTDSEEWRVGIVVGVTFELGSYYDSAFPAYDLFFDGENDKADRQFVEFVEFRQHDHHRQPEWYGYGVIVKADEIAECGACGVKFQQIDGPLCTGCEDSMQ